ncbi:MAG TPA: PilZ domain-containing protein [Lacunisphaera sp.]
MLLFKRILNFTKQKVLSSDKRGAERYTVGPGVQFKATLNLLQRDVNDKPDQRGHAGPHWVGRLVNLSTLGAKLHLPTSAFARQGETCIFEITLDDYELRIPGRIAYFRNLQNHTTCGVLFEFDFFEVQKAYLQLLEAVAIGATLAPVKASDIKPDASGLEKEVYRGKDRAQLTVWREETDGEIQRFDFRMNDYGVRWSQGQTELETYVTGAKAPGKKASPASAPLGKAEHEEVSWLFCLAVPNLAKAVQADVRKFLSGLIA